MTSVSRTQRLIHMVFFFTMVDVWRARCYNVYQMPTKYDLLLKELIREPYYYLYQVFIQITRYAKLGKYL